MRYFLILVLFFSGLSRPMAQNHGDSLHTRMLFQNPGSGGLELSTFYGKIYPSTAFSASNKSVGKMFMMEFGIHLNRKFAIGFYLARSPKTNVINVPTPDEPEYADWIAAGIALDLLPPGATQAYTYLKHSGFSLTYMHRTDRVVFWQGGMELGVGALELTAEQKQLINIFYTSIFEYRIYSFNPELGVGINLRSWWRLHADFGYQVLFSEGNEVINTARFNAATFKFGFAFGNFSR